MPPPISRGAAATAVLLCLSACFLKDKDEEEDTCKFSPVPSPIASDQRAERADRPRGEDVRLVWVDAAGQALGEYVSIVSSSRYIDRHGQYQYTTYTSEAGPLVDREGRKWKVSFDGIRPYSISPFFSTKDCSGPDFISQNFNSNKEVRHFAIEGMVVEPTAGHIAYVPLPGTVGPQCTPVLLRSLFDATGKCVEIPEYPTQTVCGYALDTLPELPPQPQTCPPTPAMPLHLEARALPENELRQCDKSIPTDAFSSPCRASRPGSGYVVSRYIEPFLSEFYVDDAHYVWQISRRQLSAVTRATWYYFTEPSCQGTGYIDTPPDAHQTVGFGSSAYARPPDWVSTRPQPLEALSRAKIREDGSISACESITPTPLGTLLSLSEMILVSPPELPPFP